ncbi:TRAP transporter substrate-binding protein [Tenuibacillus multivorans]|uniref:Tripartite ATP-independent transporter solute receptor, DctP family n=1 Tax=Tenuibacillus multivorans TaxID=237069 RepID=A0A1H0C2U4_9BACI|nr:TRAP transporter substrate-binding protein [Tenuibacillus multivorans]GEL77745.1 ABC transporter substrate-binding protein [Tenuibacillus multivorans]SDN52183.1 tripartite ATP-independent transporter solute receptor, DctP family [Tenuibacillus multivorans]
MKKFFLFLVVSLFALLLVACGGEEDNTGESQNGENVSASGDGEVKTIRAGIGLNQDHPQYKGLLKFKEIVEEETDGDIVVETYHSGQLGDDRSMTEALQLGSQEVTVPSTAPLANFVPEFSVFDIPFLFPSEEVADEVLAGEVAQDLLKKLEEKDLVGLAYWENGFRDLTNSERPVETIEDFEGLDIRTMENDLHLEAFKTLGANPTPMAFTELFTALQQGTVDGQENPYATIYLENFYEVQDYVSDTHHVYSPFVFLMSKQFYDGLTEEQQQIVRDAAIEAGEHQIKLNREANAEYLQSLIDEGMQYSEISDEERQKMVDAVQPVIEDFKDDIGPDVVDGIYEAVEQAQSE